MLSFCSLSKEGEEGETEEEEEGEREEEIMLVGGREEGGERGKGEGKRGEVALTG